MIKDKLKVIEKANLRNEFHYHLSQYDCLPKTIYILPVYEGMQGKYKATKYTMIVVI